MNTSELKPAARMFTEQIQGISLLYGVKIEGDTPGSLLDSIALKAKSNSNLCNALLSFLESPTYFASRFSSDGSLFEAITKTLVATSLRGAIHNYGSTKAPVRQHWLPVAYLNAFSSSPSTGKKRTSVPISGVSFADNFLMDFESKDGAFVHQEVNDAGFYEDSAEYFFHLVENLYAQGKNPEKERDIDTALVALFFLVQSVRNPVSGNTFKLSKLSDIVDAVLHNIDAVGPYMEARFRSTQGRLPFSPYIPPFVDSIGWTQVYSMPVAPQRLFMLSSGELTKEQWNDVPDRYITKTIQLAKEKKSFLFGVNKSYVNRILEKLN